MKKLNLLLFIFSAICQIRLDFLKLEIAKQADGTCVAGAVTNNLNINGPTALDPPELCGTLTGQHSKYQTF